MPSAVRPSGRAKPSRRSPPSPWPSSPPSSERRPSTAPRAARGAAGPSLGGGLGGAPSAALACRGHRWSLRVREPGTRPPGRAVQNTTRPRPLQRMAARHTWAASDAANAAKRASRARSARCIHAGREMRSIRSPTCRSLPWSASSISSRSRNASSADGPTTTCSRESLRRRAGCTASGCSTKGPPTANGRPGLHHVWARSFKDLYPRFHTMRGQLRRPQGRLGLPRPAGRARGREGARLQRQAADRGVRDRGVQRPLPRVGAALRRGLGGARPRGSGCGSTPTDAYWTLSNTYIESVWWHVQDDVGPRRDLRGLQGRPVLRPVRHRALEPRGRAGLRGRHRAVGVRAVPGRRS